MTVAGWIVVACTVIAVVCNVATIAIFEARLSRIERLVQPTRAAPATGGA